MTAIPLTITEKVLAAHAREDVVRAGGITTVAPDILMLNDVSGPRAFDQFDAMGAASPFDPESVVLVADHFAPAKDTITAEALRSLRGFAKTHGIAHIYEPGRGGIEHTLLAELGPVGHGSISFGSTDLAAALATGALWMRVPETIRVELVGATGPYV